MRELMVNGEQIKVVSVTGYTKNHEVKEIFGDDIIDISPCWSTWHHHKDNGIDFFWRVNGRKVEVKLGDYAEIATCSEDDEFNLDAGIKLAMVRALSAARNDIASEFIEEFPEIMQTGGEK